MLLLVEHLLESLGDNDTVVRWSAAKAIGRVSMRLPKDAADDVLEGVLERCFGPHTIDKLIHGGCLSIAELARRGLILPDRLDAIVPHVCKALHYEELNGAVNVGQHVRDAACYVAWAFARAYAPDTFTPYVEQLATALLAVAVFDREINCRRAAAAAIQEHVGRQGTFPRGIELVTLVDYWSLSNRNNAYLVVSTKAAALSDTYRKALVKNLVETKLPHPDVNIRRLGSRALARLVQCIPDFVESYVLPDLLSRLAADAKGLQSAPLVSRHGALFAIAEMVKIDSIPETSRNQVRSLVPKLEKERMYRGRGGEKMRVVACRLLQTISESDWEFKDATANRYLQTIDECLRQCVEVTQTAAVDALHALVPRLSAESLDGIAEKYLAQLADPNEHVAARRGYVLAFGGFLNQESKTTLSDARLEQILVRLCAEVRGEVPEQEGAEGEAEKAMEQDANTRQWALVSLTRVFEAVGLLHVVKLKCLNRVVGALQTAIQDYATDQRGDVGSWVREVALESLAVFLRNLDASLVDDGHWSAERTTEVTAWMLQQAVEKIDRVRARAGMKKFKTKIKNEKLEGD